METCKDPQGSGGPNSADSTPSDDERLLVEALRRGDDEAFAWLQSQYHDTMIRIAMLYVSDVSTAEDVVQETWLSVFQGIDRFEGRSSLKTWIFHILMNKAKTRAKRDQRIVPYPMMWEEGIEITNAEVDPSRFGRANLHWVSSLRPWTTTPEDQLLSDETRTFILKAIDGLPMNQKEVITLRDIEGFTAAETCSLLEITDVNQRVLLHRARTTVRRALEQYFQEQ